MHRRGAGRVGARWLALRLRGRTVWSPDESARSQTRARRSHFSKNLAELRFVPRREADHRMVTAAGARNGGAAASVPGNGEREVRLVGTDMSDRSVGRHLCDAFHSLSGSPDQRSRTRCWRSRATGRRRDPAAAVFRPRGPAAHVDRFPTPALVSRTRRDEAIQRQGGDVRVPHRIGCGAGVPAGGRRARGADRGGRAELPRAPCCSSRCSSRGRAGSACSIRPARAHHLLNERPEWWRCGSGRRSSFLPREGGPTCS